MTVGVSKNRFFLDQDINADKNFVSYMFLRANFLT